MICMFASHSLIETVKKESFLGSQRGAHFSQKEGALSRVSFVKGKGREVAPPPPISPPLEHPQVSEFVLIEKLMCQEKRSVQI